MCPECGGWTIPQLPQSYFPGWVGHTDKETGEWITDLPDIILGFPIMDASLQDVFITNWQCLPGDSMGVPSFSPNEMLAFDRDCRLDNEDLEFYGEVLGNMSSGYRKGYTQAGEYKDRLKKQKQGVR